MDRTVLSTETIRGIECCLAKSDDELVIMFLNQEERDDFARWLKDLCEDARQTPAERYEVIRRQMDSSNPSVSE